MPPRSYENPEAFRHALEQRVRSSAGGAGMARFRQVLVFDRFLARIFEHFGERAIVKGGVVLELRLERARTTRDRIYPRVVHIAEKLHAYTLPRPTENSRVKDLPDLALLAQIGPLESTAVRKALEATFAFRKTHALPAAFPAPPASWASRYAKIARDDELTWPNVDELVAAVRGFLDPVLAGDSGTWNPKSWTWQHRRTPQKRTEDRWTLPPASAPSAALDRDELRSLFAMPPAEARTRVAALLDARK